MFRQPDRDKTLGAIAKQRQYRRLLVPAAQYIRGARIFRTVAAWIGQAK